MRRLSILFFVSFAAAATYACGSATPTNETTPSGSSDTQSADSDICPILDPGPPPKCPDGCVWNGQECRKDSSIVMPDLTSRPDGGRQH